MITFGLWNSALDLLLHVFVLHHCMPIRNFYLVFLSVSQCQDIMLSMQFLNYGLDFQKIIP